jgi:hypothetical protein
MGISNAQKTQYRSNSQAAISTREESDQRMSTINHFKSSNFHNHHSNATNQYMTMKQSVSNANEARHNMLQNIYNDNYQMRRNYTAQKEIKE